MSLFCSPRERRLAIISVDRFHVGPLLKQQLHNRLVPAPRGRQQRRLANATLGFHVGPFLEQQFYSRLMSLLCSPQERRVAIISVHRFHVAPLLEQQLHTRLVPVLRG